MIVYATYYVTDPERIQEKRTLHDTTKTIECTNVLGVDWPADLVPSFLVLLAQASRHRYERSPHLHKSSQAQQQLLAQRALVREMTGCLSSGHSVLQALCASSDAILYQHNG